MCIACGNSSDDHQDHEHHHHDHEHRHEHASTRKIRLLEREILAKNDRFARENRAWLARRQVTALNLMSSPGAGKTTLLEHTIRALAGQLTISVLEGDQETERDAMRIRATGARAIQINTGTGCHLDAHTVGHALRGLEPAPGSLVMIENVGNLVCPALFDLGELAKVVILSVTEGDDKPLKYPHMFRACEVMIINKTDLLPHVTFSLERCLAHARAVQPRLRVFTVSASTGEGLDAWHAWLLQETQALQGTDRAIA